MKRIISIVILIINMFVLSSCVMQQKKLDYDGFLNYDMSKEVNFHREVISRNEDFVSKLDEKVLSGEISPSMARAELDALFDFVEKDALIQKEKILAAKSKLKKRGSL